MAEGEELGAKVAHRVQSGWRNWKSVSHSEDLVRIAQDREPWRIMTANLLKEDGT